MKLYFGHILRLALPSIATFSSMTFTGMLTLVIIGRLGPDSIAVVGVSNIIMYNMWALFAGLNESVNYLVSQNYGERTMSEGNVRLQVGLVLSLLMGVVVFAAGWVLPHSIFIWMGMKVSLANMGGPYLRVRLFAFCFTLISQIYFAYMRSVGDTKTPMFIAIVTNGLLVVLTYGLTYGSLGFPRFGLQGAAWSMVITEGLGALVSAYVYYLPYHKRFQTRTWLSMPMHQIHLIIRESAKLSVMELAMSMGMLVFTFCIARLGTSAIAANEITLNVLSLGFMPANGFGAAATIVVGQEIGALRHHQAKQIGMQTVVLGFIFMGLFSLFLVLFSHPFAHLYTSDAAVVVLTGTLLHIAAFVQVFDGSGIVLAGGLRGIGDTTFLFRMALILNWVVFVPLVIILTFVFHAGQTGAWIALCTLLVLTCVANLWRYLTVKWELLLTQSARMARQTGHATATEEVSI